MGGEGLSPRRRSRWAAAAILLLEMAGARAEEGAASVLISARYRLEESAPARDDVHDESGEVGIVGDGDLAWRRSERFPETVWLSAAGGDVFSWEDALIAVVRGAGAVRYRRIETPVPPMPACPGPESDGDAAGLHRVDLPPGAVGEPVQADDPGEEEGRGMRVFRFRRVGDAARTGAEEREAPEEPDEIRAVVGPGPRRCREVRLRWDDGRLAVVRFGAWTAGTADPAAPDGR